ncbi:F-box/kelch-repeat protein At3g06240-like [Salvia miltiorrhiza]|uniref:F-box/kelch-repeat protein At3g06240-like n=1 Tax=Salvia miltiorrhiza TaxID=226208 RepID=UPI0025ACD5ED|nr:F-box/kelch-repeat protein At3g06240-like [Salvia miltiorrhiza]XP_057786312.1 F-box/kelch-repeat protein At3g06240-like [Salvia miltiorrhiza]
MKKTKIEARNSPNMRQHFFNFLPSEACNIPNMGQHFFNFLPSEIILNILSRLPTRTTMICKCVCKPWLNLLATNEFVKSHLSKSVPGLVVFEWKTHPKPHKIVEFVNKLDFNCHEHRWNVLFNFDLPFCGPTHSSANGLLFLCEGDGDIFVCNPITREYIRLPSPLPRPYSKPRLQRHTYGFGVSRSSGKFKVVRILSATPERPDRCDCQVYTVGTVRWRRIVCGSMLEYEERSKGALLNGKLHFLASERFSYGVSCIDLETELFSTFSPPPLSDPHMTRNLSVLGDCLCVCDTASVFRPDYEIHLWLMKEYGNYESWTKEFIIRNVGMEDRLGCVCPIKVFEDGDIVMELGGRQLAYYSGKTKAIRRVDPNILSCAVVYVPSFLPLKAYAMENVSSF